MNTKRAAVTGGVVWGAVMFLTTILSVYNGYGEAFLDLMASIYPGYNVSLGGSIIGFVYGFLDVFIGIYIIAWVYKKVGK